MRKMMLSLFMAFVLFGAFSVSHAVFAEIPPTTDGARGDQIFEDGDDEMSGEELILGVTPDGKPIKLFKVKEKMFATQINDMYVNPKDYFGKAIQYEGIFDAKKSGGNTRYFVFRWGLGCCGYDGNVGFEVVWEGKNYPWTGVSKSPKKESWVEVIGFLEPFEENGTVNLRLRLVYLKVLDVRGQEIVYQ